MNYVHFLIEFNDCTIDRHNESYKEKSLTQSLSLIKTLIFYFDMRDHLMNRLNFSTETKASRKKYSATLLENFSEDQKRQFKHLGNMYRSYFDDLFSMNQKVFICLKDSEASVLWINSRETPTVFSK